MKRALSPSQASELLRAASVLPPRQRDAFLAAVDARLCSLPHRLNDGDVAAAIVSVLADADITTTSHFMCDAAPPRRLTMARYDDDDAFGPDGILRDGKRARVHMMARDADSLSDVQRAIMADKAARQFDDSAARYGPGAIYADRSVAAQVYEDEKRLAQDAWRTLAPTEAADRRRRRKATTRDPFGRETGTWKEEEDDAAGAASDAVRSVPRAVDAAEARRIKRAAYDAMVDEMCNAWRKPLP
jgi:hypothetical protein